ncbi:hypothetical protein LOZ53_000141 [Ophidiomyces ophidiicola]|nr:hypothetical protein LOZ55_000211 [Ophidiomyces ophidiicola]KAI1987211.1 hypothetical protein LOZ54_003642 [Ophidiomyces ophidiicola]KAI1998355.1 hypothetical protein LOZ53_000141 [Ophidiomyces ophidiicola]KAI2000923.1 hypothetical protein LOZ51_001210 [Ophidiomyces ophidiicola]
MERDRPEDTEQESIKPVSSLLSHFENLNRKEGKREASSSVLQAHLTNDDIPIARASLDLPRRESQWAPSHVEAQNTFRGPLQPTQTGDSPSRRRFTRPFSMSIQSTPPRGPTLTVESPRSPPYKSLIPSTRPLIGSSPKARGTSAPVNRGHDDPSTRETPLLSDTGLSASPRTLADYGQDASKSPIKSSSQPPPVNRAEKPKIPAKRPGIVSNIDTSANTLLAAQKTAVDDKISPFSTPPSSPEKWSSLPVFRGRSPNGPFPSHFSSDSPGNPVRHRPNVQSPPRLHDTYPRELSPSNRTKPKPIPNRDTKPPPPPPPMKRNGTLSKKSSTVQTIASKLATSDDSEGKPDLPPRSRSPASRNILLSRSLPQTGPESSNHPPLSASLQSYDAAQKPSMRVLGGESTVNFPPPPPPRRDTSNLSMRQTADNLPSSTPQTPISSVPPRIPAAVSNTLSKLHITSNAARDVEIRSVDEASIPKMDYPDASYTNRRPPVFRSGTRAIHTKYDTRVFDVCGQYACSTGYFTRVWDLVTGEQLLNLSHGESVKGLAIAFKPGRTVDEEGKAIWVGMSTGDICEVDIMTQANIASRSSPSRREIIKIFRHKKELWTLDDDGKLLLWPPDESGAPNLHYSYNNPYDRVPKGHTFSMVVDGILWYATGKEVRLYKPSAADTSFQILRSPLGKFHSGDVTAGAVSTRNGGVVYLGHADGKVTMYSAQSFACLGIVNVSVYKISSLAVVGDYLWAGYKTGMIYVYDTASDPWIVKKDWEAHHHGVCGLLLDPSSIWTVNKLQVVSLGVDSHIRIWDGMLEDDWLEAKMHSLDVDYCKFREISTAIVTWNIGATVPGNLPNSNFIAEAIHPEDPPDILVFGFQELVDLENKKITAKSFLKGNKRKDHEAENVSRQYRVWRDHLALCIREFMPLDTSYVLLHTASLIGLFSCVFVKQDERQRITNVNASEIKRGMGGLHGNKGALVLRFIIDDSSLCFINCHLAAGQTQTASRNNDIAAIMENDSLPAEPSSSTRIDHYVGGGDGSMILDHEICILNGDLNYRIDSMPRNTVLEAIKANNLPKLLDRDQLLASKRKNPGFRLRSFNEAPITFAPTYKYDVGTDNYDSSEKKRSPAWCDRLLYRGVGRIKQIEYRRHEVRASDHRPVSGLFKMRVKNIFPQKRTAAWEACQALFLQEKRRLATEASVDYLVCVLGVDPNEAESMISKT